MSTRTIYIMTSWWDPDTRFLDIFPLLASVKREVRPLDHHFLYDCLLDTSRLTS
jgi:hypothetical protein